MDIAESKPVKRLQRTVTVGNLWIYILSLIKKHKKAYAYTLDGGIQKEFGFKPSKIMIYIVLYKLEGEKLIESKFEERRKYYTLTTAGESCLTFAKKYFGKLSEDL